MRSLLFLSALITLTTTAAPPNIIIILNDDVGYSDIGCYGGEVQTPNLIRLVANGFRFTQFYNTAKCHTTRAELLTGNDAYSIGDNGLEHGATLGEVWYQTPLATTRGFDRYYGLASGCCNFFNPGLESAFGGQPLKCPSELLANTI
jgi:hypothetical protein